MPPESEKWAEAASSAPEACGAVFQPVIDGLAGIRKELEVWDFYEQISRGLCS
jgi:hypothetical protein